jgi:hypothetical protein
MSLTAKQARQKRLRRAALKVWLEQADRWDGNAIIYDPSTGSNIPAALYARAASGEYARFDQMPAGWRAIANEFGDEAVEHFRGPFGFGCSAEVARGECERVIDQIRGNA